ncbi:hypothetical protein D9M72_471030 [compost metagenome]
MAVQLGHERLAEPHDFGVAAAAGVEVRTALTAADGHAGEGVLEDLLEAEEFHDAQVDGRVESQAALVGAECRVELHPEAAVDLHAALVIGPRHPENDLAFGFAEPFQDGRFEEFGVPVVDGAQAFEHLDHRLVELRFSGVPGQDRVPDGLEPCIHDDSLRRTGRGKSAAGAAPPPLY